MPYTKFKAECAQEVEQQMCDATLNKLSADWQQRAEVCRYPYHFEWMGRPIIQYPQDIVAMQEIIWEVKPDLIIETGIAHGGSLIFYASMLELLASCGFAQHSCVLGIDIDIREHNKVAIEQHPLARRISMLQGSSIAPEIVAQVSETSKKFTTILVALDSMHTTDHVFAELEAYASLVTVGSYCVVFDTAIAHSPDAVFEDRPWNTCNNPLIAVKKWLALHEAFAADRQIDAKLCISEAPHGYLRRTRL